MSSASAKYMDAVLPTESGGNRRRSSGLNKHLSLSGAAIQRCAKLSSSVLIGKHGKVLSDEPLTSYFLQGVADGIFSSMTSHTRWLRGALLDDAALMSANQHAIDPVAILSGPPSDRHIWYKECLLFPHRQTRHRSHGQATTKALGQQRLHN